MDFKKNILYNTLLKYYDTKENFESFVNILKETSCISLRLIDWFVTKYAKLNEVCYEWQGKDFHVHTQYKSQLKAYSKRHIDPFCRRERIILQKNGIEIVTTIGQMNFFRWAIENGILTYILNNFQALDVHMRSDNRKKMSKKNTKVKHTSTSHKDVPKTNSQKKSFTKKYQSITISFD